MKYSACYLQNIPWIWRASKTSNQPLIQLRCNNQCICGIWDLRVNISMAIEIQFQTLDSDEEHKFWQKL